MSESNRNKYSHLPNCRADICAAGCPHTIFKYGYEAALEDSAALELLEVCIFARENLSIIRWEGFETTKNAVERKLDDAIAKAEGGGS